MHLPVSAKKKLKNMFYEHGELTMLNSFLMETQKKLKTEKHNDLRILSSFLKEIGKFQDRNFVGFNQMGKGLQKRMQLKTQKQLFEFNETLSVCERDNLKNPEHQSKVKNDNIKGLFFNEGCFINFSFVENFKEGNFQPLSYCTNKLAKDSGVIAKEEYMETADTAKKYMLENISKLLFTLSELRESVRITD